MPRTRTLAGVLATAALAVSGCGTPGPPELTAYADGEAIELAPVTYCDVLVQHCEANPNAQQHLLLRPGKPVQLSVPTQVAESPWAVSVWSTHDPQTPRQEFLAPGEAFSYTARPHDPRGQIVEIQVLQLGAAQDTAGNLLARGLWTLQLRSR